MTNAQNPKPALHTDQRGMALVEFALIAPVLLLMIIGFLDLGHRIYYTSIIQGTLQEAARLATVGDKTQSEIDTYVTGRLQGLSQNPNIVINKKSYTDYNGVKKPEKIVTDTAPLGVYNAKTPTTPGDCHEDVVANGIYDTDRGKGGLGGADDVVYYEISLTYNRLFPMSGMLGWSAQQNIAVNTVLKNQPYAAQVKGAATVCA